ncbi:MAG: SDR family oxidoreductase [Burkholderiaceae bacterium]
MSTTQRLIDVREEDFDFIFDTNTRGAFFVAQAVARRMISRAKDTPEHSGAHRPALRRWRPQGAGADRRLLQSKAAVVQMTRAMALEWGRWDQCQRGQLPGYISTEINEHHWSTEAGQRLIQMTPRKRLGKPQEDLDGLLLLLCSDDSSFINSAAIGADDSFGL